MRLLIDSDTILYRAAFAAERKLYICPDGNEFRYHKEAVAHCKRYELDMKETSKEVILEGKKAAIHNVKQIMGTILSATGSGDYTCYVAGDGNFRYDINPEYKAGRPPKPFYYNDVKEYLITHEGAVVVDGMEVDDKVSIEQWKDYRLVQEGVHSKGKPDTMIVTVDKDLDMVPGHHFNWVKNEMYFITEEEGDVNFYNQLLTGDRTDNIHGLAGVGPVGANKILEGKTTSKERYDSCVEAYQDHGRDDLEKVARQIWMSKVEPNDWRIPE